ncbi:MAG: tetraacyldisaccharide 4'-kinase [Candidatus Marinimicrobia bacterium]|nr:tetraacyldisaccharide 4'-kinase [Candidatus Neomarinimicrobiota bacterium]
MSNHKHSTINKWRFFLFPLAVVYQLIMVCRNLFYNIGFFVTRSLPAAVISIGNITTGGTGKTPTVIAMANWLKDEGFSVAILSRGYGRTTSGTVIVTDGNTIEKTWQEVGDEPAMMAKLTDSIPIVVDENRYRGSMFLYKQTKPDIIILDDAFQHRAIARDIDLVLVSAGDSVQDHKLLPHGNLREPWNHIKRADAILASKSNLFDPKPFLVAQLKRTPVPSYKTEFTSILKHHHGNPEESPFVMVCALGDPHSFRSALDHQDITISYEMTYSDHYQYTQNDIEQMQKSISHYSANGIVCTDKDWIKLASLEIPFSVYVLSIEIILPDDLKTFISDRLPKS